MKRILPALTLLLLASCSQDAGAPASAPSAAKAKQERSDTGGRTGSAVPESRPARVRTGKASARSAAPAPMRPRSGAPSGAPSGATTEEPEGYVPLPDDFGDARSSATRRQAAASPRKNSETASMSSDKANKTPVAPRKHEEPVHASDQWGGRIFLSNDDSMSLASAQRVLWSVAHGERVQSAQLRPHELLNYFTFDKPAIAKGDRFGVSASAVRTEEGLTLALTVTGGTPARRPLDLTLLVDRSGSMQDEERIDYVKRGLVAMLARLRDGDRVDLLAFDEKVDVLRTGFVVGKDDLDDLRLAIDELRPDGSTNLDAGLESAYAFARTHAKNPDAHGRDTRVLVVTDARLTSGDVNADRVTEIGRAFDESGIRLAAVGVGSDFDDAVLQRLTEKGRGAYVYLGSEKVVDRVFGAGFDSLVRVVADDVRFALDLPPSLGMRRFYGEEMSTVAADVTPVSFHAGTTQLFLQDLKVARSGLVNTDPLVLDVAWRDPITGKDRSQRWSSTVGDVLAADRRNVAKARALMAWTDLVRVGNNGCQPEKREWTSLARTFGGDLETRYLDKLVAGWCRDPESGGMIAEAE